MGISRNSFAAVQDRDIRTGELEWTHRSSLNFSGLTVIPSQFSKAIKHFLTFDFISEGDRHDVGAIQFKMRSLWRKNQGCCGRA
jgi:hypothetical protein